MKRKTKNLLGFLHRTINCKVGSGVLHGGISATILDETIGRAIMMYGGQSTFGVTIELNVKYKKPVPLKGLNLKRLGVLWAIKDFIFEGTGELLLPNGEVAVSAEENIA